MRKDKYRFLLRVGQVLLSIFVTLLIIGVLIFVTQGRDIPVLDTHGLIADQEKNLILVVFALGFFIVIPVFILLFSIAWRYRAGNTKAKYQPEFESHRGLEALWWGIPCLFIVVLAIITAVSTHALDPYKPIDSKVEPVKIQVIALEWKWLFIYPDEEVATVNYINIPKDTPINFTITSDAPMNSFWVPALAGQVYAMSGMSTKLHFMANSAGTFNGVSANISGDGYAGMTFKVNSMEQADYDAWVKKSETSPQYLTEAMYQKLEQPSKNEAQATYVLNDFDLYNKVIMKYMSSEGNASTGELKAAL